MSRTIEISRAPGEPWKFEFGDEIGIRDIKILGRKMIVEFLRAKRRKRLRAKVISRETAKPSVKEAANAAA